MIRTATAADREIRLLEESDRLPGPGRVVVGVGPLSFDDVIAVARRGAAVQLGDDALMAIDRARQVIENLAASPMPAYGISTGFGALATRHIAPDLRMQLQRSLVRSHAAGSGTEVEREVVRALMLLRLSTLATGHTGVRRQTAELLAALLTHGITPVVYEYGSLGCSGDLAPLAHCALVLMGEGTVRDAKGDITDSATALAAAGLEPVELREKEGLALINGTDGMLGMLVLAIDDLTELLRVADISAAMSVEGQLGTDRVFAAELQAIRPHRGQKDSAANLTALLHGSPIVASHRGPDCNRVQDAYSLRCAPQVNGAARDTVAHAKHVATIELSAAVDNPVVLAAEGRVESNGNFHGAPLAYVLDFLAIIAADVASISERRTDRFLDSARNHGLPPFLADDPGVDSGLMIAQYTQAAIVSELKRLATPASVDSIPSSAMQEDHVSMGWSAARKLRRSIDGLSRVLAIEVMTAARGINLRRLLRPGPGTGAVVELLRTHGVSVPGTDRYLAPKSASPINSSSTAPSPMQPRPRSASCSSQRATALSGPDPRPTTIGKTVNTSIRVQDLHHPDNAPHHQRTPRPVDMIKLLPEYSQAAGRGHVTWIASSNESTIPPSPTVQAAIADAATHGNRYPSLFGSELAAAIAQRLRVTDDQVMVGAGSLALLQMALLAFTGPGTDVVYAWRSYEAYPMLVTLAGATPISVPLDSEHRHDPRALTQAVGPKCRALILCSPNNPTGTLLTPDEVEATLRTVPSDVLVILDEAYREFTGIDFDAVSLLARYPNLVIMRTFSKAYGLAGIRAGYLISNAPVAQAIQRTSPPFTLSATASAGALAAWSDEAYTRRVVHTVCQDRDRLQSRLRELGVQTPTSASNFVWIPTPRHALRLEQLCVQEGVAIRVFDGFGARVTAGDPDASDAAVQAAANLVTEVGSLDKS